MPVTAYDWLAHHARRTPGKIAAIDHFTQRRFTYTDFNARAEALAAHMALKLHVQPGERVAVLGPNSTDIFEIQFACAKMGAIFVPLNWRLAVPELEFILKDCSPALLIHDAEFGAAARELVGLCGIGQALELNGSGQPSVYEGGIAAMLKAGVPDFPRPPQTLDDVSTILYTSGTTGLPKGAMITHGMTFFNAVNISPIAQLNSRTVCLTVLPLFHTGGLNVYANGVFHAGGTVVVMRTFEPKLCLGLLADASWGLTHFLGVPAMYQFMMHEPAFAASNFEHLEICGIGAAPAPLALLQTWADKGVPLIQTYGMTETGPIVLMLDADRAAEKVGSSGPPILHAEVRVVDEHGNDLPVGQVGEIWVRGPAVTPGYWNRPEATAELVTDGWLHTGDAVRVDEDGYYFIVDRWKDMYISGGENVYPAEVENAVYTLSEVAECAVIGVPDEKWGEVGKVVVVLKPGVSLEAPKVIERCRERLARFKVPKYVEFAPALPRNATGKLLKRELRAQAGEGRG